MPIVTATLRSMLNMNPKQIYLIFRLLPALGGSSAASARGGRSDAAADSESEYETRRLDVDRRVA